MHNSSSRLYLQYKLCLQLMDGFQQMVAREALPPVPHPSGRRRFKTTPTPITLLRPQPPPVQRSRLPSVEGAATALAHSSQLAAEGHTQGRQKILEPAIRNVDIVSNVGTVSPADTLALPPVHANVHSCAVKGLCHTPLHSPTLHYSSDLSPPSQPVFPTLLHHSNLSQVTGMDHFIHFLQSTRGRDLVDLWMDVQELNTLHDSGVERTPPTHEGRGLDSEEGYLGVPTAAHADYLCLKYSHFLASEDAKGKRTLAEAQDLASDKLQTYWLPRYLLQMHWVTQHRRMSEVGPG